IVGGGFAGLQAARGLGKTPVDVTLVDRRNFHLFQPLLYQVATGGLSPGEISAPLRAVLKRQTNTTVLLGEIVDIDPDRFHVILNDRELPYDTLIVAAGARHHYFGHSEWEEAAPGLKTIENATEIRGRILGAFEAAELETDPELRQSLLTFVIVGAGPTGVELAGAIGELARYTMKREFRHIDPSAARILLVEGSDRVLPPYKPELSAAAQRSLERLGVEVLPRVLVADIGDISVTLRRENETWRVAAATVLWAAGVQPSPLANVLSERAGAKVDRTGRIEVTGNCTIPGHPEILVLGDMAHHTGPDGQPLPGVAPVAMQQGKYAARLIARRLAGKTTTDFKYRNWGELAVIGRAAGVADLGVFHFSGYFAWLLWLFVHIMYLVGFANRILVLFQWAYSYITRGRGARIIAHSTVAGAEAAEARPRSDADDPRHDADLDGTREVD
ncbi:MAG: NAD(P)/FAD-dependent oxidoreductase, partial [Thermoanaerobaculia bacterium]